jgi:hypothetical protein
VAELEQKVREETSLRFALEIEVNKMRCELQVMKTDNLLRGIFLFEL